MRMWKLVKQPFALLNSGSGYWIQWDVNLCHIALRIHFHQLIRKWTAWTTPCRHVKTLSVTINQISRAGVWFDKVCSPFSGEQLPSHVTWCNFIRLSKQFPFLVLLSELDESWHVVKAWHKMNVSVSKHLLHFHQPLNHIYHASQACYWLILREIPMIQGKLQSTFRWLRKSFMCTFIRDCLISF